MLKQKIKGIILSLSNEKVSVEYLCQLTNESSAEVLKIVKELKQEKFIKDED